MSIEKLKKNKTFEGHTCFYQHDSNATKTKMKFSTFEPSIDKIDSAIIWLSGLTCNEENFITKSGVQKHLQGTNTMIVCPDTSPRGLDLVGEHESYDFGSGAGFYVNATSDGYSDHYKMYDYIATDLVSIIKEHFNIDRISIMGHSMGGHGAMVLGLREQERFCSVSAFSPIVNPLNCDWGKKAFKGYLNSNIDHAKQYDSVDLVKNGKKRKDTILIDQGLEDEFLKDQLKTSLFEDACQKHGQSLIVNYREGYDHSYYFISTFIEKHINFHLSSLGRKVNEG